jgi:adenylate kinase
LKGIIGITGSPGTGKKSVSPLVASKLGLECLSINEVARRRGLIEEEGDVDVGALRRWLPRELSGRCVAYGHLLPYVLVPRLADRVVILRCEPSLLKVRLARRGYPQEKIDENVEGELIGVVSAAAFKAFGRLKAFELDTTASTPAKVAGRIVRVLRGESKPDRPVDWTLSYDSGAKLRSLVSPR